MASSDASAAASSSSLNIIRHTVPMLTDDELRNAFEPMGKSAQTTLDNTVVEMPELQRVIQSQGEHRGDGYDAKENKFFTRTWLDAELMRKKVLEQNYMYKFVKLASGKAGLDVEDFISTANLDEHVRSIMTRANVSDQFLKKSLVDLDKVLKGMEYFNTNLKAELERHQRFARIALLLEDQSNRYKALESRLESDKPSTNSTEFDALLLQRARDFDASEGVESERFSLELQTVIASLLAQKNPSFAAENNPPASTLAINYVFSLYMLREFSQSHIDYISQRIYASNVFSQDGEYAKDSTRKLYIRDVQVLAKLLEKQTKGLLRFSSASASLYLHLERMRKRWYAADEYATTEDSELVPPGASQKSINEARDDLIEVDLFDETDDPESIDSASVIDFDKRVLDKQNETKKVKGNDKYMSMCNMFLAPLYRHGLALLFFDLTELRQLICASNSTFFACLNEREANARAKDASSTDKATENVSNFTNNNSKLRTFFDRSRSDPTQKEYEALLAFSVGGVSLRDNQMRAQYDDIQIPSKRTKTRKTMPILGQAPESAVDFRVGNTSEIAIFIARVDKLYERNVENTEAQTQESGPSRRSPLSQKDSTDFILLLNQRIRERNPETRKIGRARVLLSGVGDAFARALLNLNKAEVLRHAGRDSEQNLVQGLPALDEVTYENSLETVVNFIETDPTKKAKEFSDNLRQKKAKIKKLATSIEKNMQADEKRVRRAGNSALSMISERYNGVKMEKVIEKDAETLRKIVAATNVPNEQWIMSAANTGELHLNAQFASAVSEAISILHKNSSKFAHLSPDDFIRSESGMPPFAALVGAYIRTQQALASKQLTLDRVYRRTCVEFASTLERMRDLDPNLIALEARKARNNDSHSSSSARNPPSRKHGGPRIVYDRVPPMYGLGDGESGGSDSWGAVFKPVSRNSDSDNDSTENSQYFSAMSEFLNAQLELLTSDSIISTAALLLDETKSLTTEFESQGTVSEQSLSTYTATLENFEKVYETTKQNTPPSARPEFKMEFTAYRDSPKNIGVFGEAINNIYKKIFSLKKTEEKKREKALLKLLRASENRNNALASMPRKNRNGVRVDYDEQLPYGGIANRSSGQYGVIPINRSNLFPEEYVAIPDGRINGAPQAPQNAYNAIPAEAASPVRTGDDADSGSELTSDDDKSNGSGLPQSQSKIADELKAALRAAASGKKSMKQDKRLPVWTRQAFLMCKAHLNSFWQTASALQKERVLKHVQNAANAAKSSTPSEKNHAAIQKSCTALSLSYVKEDPIAFAFAASNTLALVHHTMHAHTH